MAEASSLIPASVLRGLTDKLYEKRKKAAVTVLVFDLSVVFLFSVDMFS